MAESGSDSEGSQHVDKEKALHMAHASKASRDEAAKIRTDIKELREKKGLRAIIKRKLQEGRAKSHDRIAESEEETVDSSIEQYRTMKWYALTGRLYNETIERAEKMNDPELVAALVHDRDLSAKEAWEQRFASNRPVLARMVEATALVGSDFTGKAISELNLAGTRQRIAWNPLKAVSEIDQGEETTRVDLDIVRKAYDLFGLEGKDNIPQELPRKGHFAIAAPDILLRGVRLPDKVLGVPIPEASRQVVNDKSIKKTPEDLEGFPVKFQFEYHPERTRSGGGEEPPVYIPERLSVKISNTRERT